MNRSIVNENRNESRFVADQADDQIIASALEHEFEGAVILCDPSFLQLLDLDTGQGQALSSGIHHTPTERKLLGSYRRLSNNQ